MAGSKIAGRYVNRGGLEDFRVTAPEAIEDPSRLDGASMASLFAYVAAERLSGLLSVEPRDVDPVVLGIKKGQLVSVDIRGRPFMERVFDRLLESGAITKGDLDKAKDVASGGASSVLQSLFELGSCTPRDIVDAIKAAKEGVLETLLESKEGSFELDCEASLPKLSDPLFIDLTLFLVRRIKSVTKHSYAADIQPFLEPYMGRYPVKSPRLTPMVEGIAFGDKERKTLDEVVDGSVTLREVFSLTLLTKGATARLFLIATFLGFVEYRLKPAAKGGVEELLEELEDRLREMAKDDFFTRLGIHWTTHPSKILPAYRKLAEKYGPEAEERKLSPKVAEVMDQIMRLLEEAKDTLMDTERRKAYRRNLLGEAKLNFGATFLYKQAHMAKFRGDLKKTSELIDAALDIKPSQQFLDFLRTVKEGCVRDLGSALSANALGGDLEDVRHYG